MKEPVPPTDVPKFDIARLSKAKYLTAPETAWYLGYTAEHYKHPYEAFYKCLTRNRFLTRYYFGRRLRFLRSEVEAVLDRRTVAGGHA